MKQPYIEPEWITVDAACQWLGVDKTTLFRMRKTHGLVHTCLTKGRGLMYDKNQIIGILNRNSTCDQGFKETSRMVRKMQMAS